MRIREPIAKISNGKGPVQSDPVDGYFSIFLYLQVAGSSGVREGVDSLDYPAIERKMHLGILPLLGDMPREASSTATG